MNIDEDTSASLDAVSAKLAKDYAGFAERAEAVGGYFWEKYKEWRIAFDLAADDGAVSFH